MNHPIVTITLSDGGVLKLELYPEVAPQAVASFLSLARQGVFDHYPIERIVPGWVVDVSYHAFHDPRACYFIPNDVKSGTYLEAAFGTVGLGATALRRSPAGSFSSLWPTAPPSPAPIPSSAKWWRDWRNSAAWRQRRPTPSPSLGSPR